MILSKKFEIGRALFKDIKGETENLLMILEYIKEIFKSR